MFFGSESLFSFLILIKVKWFRILYFAYTVNKQATTQTTYMHEIISIEPKEYENSAHYLFRTVTFLSYFELFSFVYLCIVSLWNYNSKSKCAKESGGGRTEDRIERKISCYELFWLKLVMSITNTTEVIKTVAERFLFILHFIGMDTVWVFNSKRYENRKQNFLTVFRKDNCNSVVCYYF